MAFGWGIVSTGRHPGLKVAPAMGAASGAELVAVYSRDQGRADAFAQRHGARAAYSKLGDLLGDSRVDGVFVCSPNALHAEQRRPGGAGGQARALREADGDHGRGRRAHGAGVPARGGDARRRLPLAPAPAHVRAREIVAGGALGRVVVAHGQWAFGVRGRDGSPPRDALNRWWEDHRH